MNGKRAKMLRALAAKLRTRDAEDKYTGKEGAIKHSGSSREGTYKELKKKYKKLMREGKEPWRTLNKNGVL